MQKIRLMNEKEGWSPHAARDFLADEGMRTGDYHSDFDDEWWCGVVTKEVDDGILPSTANYSFTGIEGLVTKIRMRSHFMDDFVKVEALDEFSRLEQLLLERATQVSEIRETLSKLKDHHPFEISTGATRIELKRDRFPSEKGFELVLELTRSADQSAG